MRIHRRRYSRALREVSCPSWEGFRNRLLAYAALPREVRDTYVFRGQPDSLWGLESSIDRQFATMPPMEREARLRRLLRDFEAELLGIDTAEAPNRITDRLELLGRHHLLPTTLLDWTRSPYVAAYFAYEIQLNPLPERVAVWVFDRKALLRIEQGNAPAVDVIDDVKLLMANTRAIEQRAVSIRAPVGVPLEELLGKGLTKFTIPSADRRLALVDLDGMLITARSLFRDRDGAARTAMIRESIR